MANEVVPTRQSIAANMYALRAGLSVVSGEVQKGQHVIDKAKAHLDQVKETAAENAEGAQMVVDHWTEAKEKLNDDYWFPVAKICIYSILVILCVGLLAFSVAFWMGVTGLLIGEASDPMYAWLEELGSSFTTPGLLMPIAAIIGLIIFAKLLASAVYDKQWFTRRYDHDVKPTFFTDEIVPNNKKRELEDIPNPTYVKVDPKYIERKISAAETDMARIKRNGYADINAAEAEYITAIATAKINHIMPAKTMYSALANLFSYMVDERDWANLDYLIYAVETGRAESIKEALQLLDKEKQTDRIVAAIQAASREIAQLLVTGFTALSNQISSGISMLSQQIRENSYQTAHLSARMSQIADAQTLNNALLAKANESSEQLVSDVHRIAELENMRYNRGY